MISRPALLGLAVLFSVACAPIGSGRAASVTAQEAQVPDPAPSPAAVGRGGPPSEPSDYPGARPGPYRLPAQTDFRQDTFSSGERIAGTYYFYWYDWASKLFMEPPPSLPRPPAEPRFKPAYYSHPPDREQVSFCNPAWHKREISDMMAAGLDFFLPIFWGRPGRYGRADGVPVCSTDRERGDREFWAWRDSPELAAIRDAWSTEGLGPMIQAMDEIAGEGRRPPRIGMFLDTTIMDNADLRSPDGQAYFYAIVRDFFSRVPPGYWAAVDGHPILWIYDAQRVAAFDQTTFDYVYERFPRDFGSRRPFIVRELQWKDPKVWNDNALAASLPPIHTESLYAWGAAPFGFNPDVADSVVAQVGPGFNTRGWPNEVYTDRENGAFYQRNMAAALRSGKPILMVETWNEWTESSGVDETVEFGRKYIDLTRQCLELFKRGAAPRGDACRE